MTEPLIIGENCFPDAIKLPEHLADAWDSVVMPMPPPKPITFYQFCNVDGDYGMKVRGDDD